MGRYVGFEAERGGRNVHFFQRIAIKLDPALRRYNLADHPAEKSEVRSFGTVSLVLTNGGKCPRASALHHSSLHHHPRL